MLLASLLACYRDLLLATSVPDCSLMLVSGISHSALMEMPLSGTAMLLLLARTVAGFGMAAQQERSPNAVAGTLLAGIGKGATIKTPRRSWRSC